MIAETKICFKCKASKSHSEYSYCKDGKDALQSYCKDCCAKTISDYRDNGDRKARAAVRNKAWRKNNPERIKLLELRSRTKKFGINPEAYERMVVSQGGVCAICRTLPNSMGLAIDHNHKTGKVRGLLCGRCNPGIGMFQDNIELLKSAIEYLEKQ